jgi:hypothetical protein
VITDGVTGDAACGDLAPTSLSPPADRGARLAEAKRVSLVNLVFLAFLLAQVAVEGWAFGPLRRLGVERRVAGASVTVLHVSIPTGGEGTWCGE